MKDLHPGPKIFCIGFHKTGTTSLDHALGLLGYNVLTSFGIPNSQIMFPLEQQARKLLDNYDAFADNPWPILYQQLDQWAPNSKFILTFRDTEQWYDSVLTHFGNHPTAMRGWIYGKNAPLGNEEVYKTRFEAHNTAVRRYFQNRPDDLLIMELGKSFDWPALCTFLEKPIPETPFPTANTRNERATVVNRFKKIIKRFKAGTQ